MFCGVHHFHSLLAWSVVQPHLLVVISDFYYREAALTHINITTGQIDILRVTLREVSITSLSRYV